MTCFLTLDDKPFIAYGRNLAENIQTVPGHLKIKLSQNESFPHIGQTAVNMK